MMVNVQTEPLQRLFVSMGRVLAPRTALRVIQQQEIVIRAIVHKDTVLKERIQPSPTALRVIQQQEIALLAQNPWGAVLREMVLQVVTAVMAQAPNHGSVLMAHLPGAAWKVVECQPSKTSQRKTCPLQSLVLS